MSAFTLASGIDRLFDDIEIGQRKRTVITGIRNGITSAQALRRFLQLGFDTYIIDTGRSDLLFHAKVFAFYDEKKASVVLGSANLTTGGLLNNIEAGTLIELELDNKDDKAYLQAITCTLTQLQVSYPANIRLIQRHDEIDDLFRRGLVIDERQAPQAHSMRHRAPTPAQDTPRINIHREPDTAVDIQVLTGEPHFVENENEDRIESPNLLILRSQLVYEKQTLSRSDAQIVSGGTNPTGNVRLSGSGFSINGQPIDWRTYFRNEVFGAYLWNRKNGGSSEEAMVDFRVIINGVDYGIHSIRLSHDPEREAKQNNVPTWLHWGNLISIVQAINIEGRSLKIYSPAEENTPFVIMID